MTKSACTRASLIPYPVIAAAVGGDPEAVSRVVRHYSGYIAALSTRTSYDPECLNNVPAGNNSNGAACHSCCMISETACENGNRMLDRGLIVPIDGRENQSYFKTLVEELCQLEV